jgi:hypothetical protein
MNRRTPLEAFERLGNRILRLWRMDHFKTERFSAIALSALEEELRAQPIDRSEIIDWALGAGRMAPQFDLAGTFGEPPITLYSAPEFVIEVLFWVDGTTSIHEHSFSGAFHVLEGSSIHSRFEFREERRVNDRLRVGELVLQDVELLETGQTRPIVSGSRFIHSLFHLDRPSLTILVRTRADPVSSPQLTYRWPGVAHDPFYRDAMLTKKMQLLRLTHVLDDADYFERVARLLESLDLPSVVRVVDEQRRALGKEERRTLMEVARRPLGSLHERMVEVYEEEQRIDNLVGRRRIVQDPRHRFLLALLLNVRDRMSILHLVERRYGGDPVSRVVEWVRELCAKEGGSGSNAIGVDFDETSLCVFEMMLKGMDLESMLDELAQRYDGVEESREGLEELCRTLRRSRMFRTLLSS